MVPEKVGIALFRFYITHFGNEFVQVFLLTKYLMNCPVVQHNLEVIFKATYALTLRYAK